MIVFTVHEPPHASADKLDRAEAIVFVRDGFSALAALLGPLWLLLNGLWLAWLIAIAVAGLGVGLFFAGAPLPWVAALWLAVHLVIGFEGRNIERWTLERRGWTMVGSVTGQTIDECERRFFEAWLPRQPFIEQGRMATPGGSMGVSAPESSRVPLWRRLVPRGRRT